MRKRDQDRRSANHAELGNRRSAGTADDEMGFGNTFRHVVEEGCEVRFHSKLRVGCLDRFEILRPALLCELHCPRHCIGKSAKNARHEFGEEPRPLAAAEYEHAKWSACIWRI